ncbi:hypothetical protein Pelo_18243 [Pelomyxa schiedti]|nr:hypothetical protein Pelo_18243 [Pelomyxa schiedti]
MEPPVPHLTHVAPSWVVVGAVLTNEHPPFSISSTVYQLTTPDCACLFTLPHSAPVDLIVVPLTLIHSHHRLCGGAGLCHHRVTTTTRRLGRLGLDVSPIITPDHPLPPHSPSLHVVKLCRGIQRPLALLHVYAVGVVPHPPAPVPATPQPLVQRAVWPVPNTPPVLGVVLPLTVVRTTVWPCEHPPPVPQPVAPAAVVGGFQATVQSNLQMQCRVDRAVAKTLEHLPLVQTTDEQNEQENNRKTMLLKER